MYTVHIHVYYPIFVFCVIFTFYSPSRIFLCSWSCALRLLIFWLVLCRAAAVFRQRYCSACLEVFQAIVRRCTVLEDKDFWECRREAFMKIHGPHLTSPGLASRSLASLIQSVFDFRFAVLFFSFSNCRTRVLYWAFWDHQAICIYISKIERVQSSYIDFV